MEIGEHASPQKKTELLQFHTHIFNGATESLEGASHANTVHFDCDLQQWIAKINSVGL